MLIFQREQYCMLYNEFDVVWDSRGSRGPLVLWRVQKEKGTDLVAVFTPRPIGPELHEWAWPVKRLPSKRDIWKCKGKSVFICREGSKAVVHIAMSSSVGIYMYKHARARLQWFSIMLNYVMYFLLYINVYRTAYAISILLYERARLHEHVFSPVPQDTLTHRAYVKQSCSNFSDL